MKLYLLAVLFGVLACAQTASADSPVAPPSSAQPPYLVVPAESVLPDDRLEAVYAKKFEDKVTRETERAKDSLNSLFYGATLVLLGILGLSLVALFRTRRQQLELDDLRAKLGQPSA